MSQIILWLGFVVSSLLLLGGIFVAERPNPLVLLFWAVICAGSGYRLFFKK